MKKLLVLLITFIVFFCIYFLQSNFFSWFTIAGVKPNLFIIFALILGLFWEKSYIPILCAFFGFLLDLFCSDIIGINTIMMGIAGISGGILNKNFSKESRITIMIMTGGITLACEIVSYLLRIIIFGTTLGFLPFLKIVGIEMFYNIILIIILYPLIQSFGNWIEKVFTEDKILTRYF